MPFMAENIPYVPKSRITEEKKGEMYLILAPELPNCISVNADGRDILDLCDGKKSIREIAEEMSLRRGKKQKKISRKS